MTISLPPAPAHPRRLAYLGTPEMAVAPLQALHAAGHEIALVVSRPDKRRGRGGDLQPSPVKAAALQLGLMVSDDLHDVVDAGVDLAVVVAYGRIIPPAVLERVPMVNLHFSLLPRWRGAAPVERAILAGDSRTGIDLMVVEEGLDTGGIYAERVVDIGPDETAEQLRGRLVDAGAALLVTTLATGLGSPRAQVGDTIYAEKFTAADFEIDWRADGDAVHRLIRVGGAWTTFRGKRLKIWAATPVSMSDVAERQLAPGELAVAAGERVVVGTGGGLLTLLEVQPEGKARQEIRAWRNGARPTDGELFT